MEPTTEETFDDDGILREPGLRLLRSLSLGSAGASFIVIMSLFQMNKSSDALSWVLYGAVLAMPLFLLSVTAYQIYLMGGGEKLSSYADINRLFYDCNTVFNWSLFFGVLCNLSSLRFRL